MTVMKNFASSFRQAEQRLCIRRVRKQMMASSVAAIISDLKQEDAPIIACNDAFLHLSGYDRSEVLGQNCRFLNRGKLDPAASQQFREAIATGCACLVEVNNFRKDGTEFTNCVTLSPIRDSKGNVVAMLGSQIDRSRDDPNPLSLKIQRAQSKLTKLSSRQREVAIATAQGKQIKEIGYELGISERTVKLHRKEIVSNLGVKNSTQAVRIVIEAGL